METRAEIRIHGGDDGSDKSEIEEEKELQIELDEKKCGGGLREGFELEKLVRRRLFW